MLMPIKDPTKRREYQKKLMAERRANGLTKNVSPDVRPSEIVSPVSPIEKVLDPNVSPDNLVSPKMLDPVSLCSRCPELENSITNFANLYYQEQEKSKNYQQTIRELNKEIVNKKQIEEKLLKEKELDKQTISNLATKNQQLIEKYSKLEKQSKNNNNSLSMTNL